MRELAYARATRPSSLEAIAVAVDAEETAELRRRWEELEVPLALTVLDSPYREVTRPVLEFVKAIRRNSQRDLVVVYVPEYVVGRWWGRVRQNICTIRIEERGLRLPGLDVCTMLKHHTTH